MEVFSWQDKDADGNKVVYEASYFGGWGQLASAPKLGGLQREEVGF